MLHDISGSITFIAIAGRTPANTFADFQPEMFFIGTEEDSGGMFHFYPREHRIVTGEAGGNVSCYDTSNARKVSRKLLTL